MRAPSHLCVTQTHVTHVTHVTRQQTWRYLVLDEGHRVRNMDTLTARALRAVQRGNVLLLTGAWCACMA
jgi:hypothetical protein